LIFAMLNLRILSVSGFSTGCRGAVSGEFSLARGSGSNMAGVLSSKPLKSSTNDAETTSSNKEDEKHVITWITPKDTIEFTAATGETLRSAALRSGVISPHNGRANLINCRGLGTCGTCAVSIAGEIDPSERNTVEQVRLSVPPGHGMTSVESDLRLACQVQVRGDLKVTKYAGFWGQHIGEVAEKSPPTLPFGAFEFILDSKSPESKK